MGRFCTNCGTEASNNASYCTICGFKLQDRISNDYDAQRESGSATYAQPVGQQPYSGSNTQYAQQNYTHNSSPAQVEKTPTQMVQQAWKDLQATPSWLPKMLLFGLLSLIPIVNFFVYGALMAWAVSRAKTTSNSEIPSSFTLEYLKLGFMGLLVTFLWMLVVGVFASIPVVGLAVTIFASPFMSLCIVRLALYGKFGNAFEFTRIWNVFKKNPGAALIVFWIPSLIFALIVFVVMMVLSMCLGLPALLLYSYDYSVAFIDGFSIVSVLLCLIFGVVCAAFNTAVIAIVFRAYLYFIQEQEPQWIREAA